MKFLKSFELFESKIHITTEEVPREILNWSQQFAKKITKITIEQVSTVEISLPWHEADSTTYQFFKLTPNNTAEMVGNDITRSGTEGNGFTRDTKLNGKVTIPSGYVLACVGTYPLRLTLYTASDALKPIVAPNLLDEFTVDELLILLGAKGLKSAYRTKYPEDKYTKLIENGYLAKNKSITIKGRNIVEMPGVKDKINKYAEENGLYLDSSYKLSKKW